MRHLELYGVVRNRKVVKLARRCAWCRKWASSEDYRAAHEDNAKVSHGMCSTCERDFVRKIDALNNDLPPHAA